MNNIAQQCICLKLNSNWKPVEEAAVGSVIVDLVSGVVLALDIGYNLNPDGTRDTREFKYVNPVAWEEWITLPIYPWHLVIHSTKLTVRVPTIVIAKNYDEMPMKEFKTPTKDALFYRDNGRDIYTGKPIAYEDATRDHIFAKHLGGTDTFENMGLTTKETNNRKGHKLNSEVGLVPKFKPGVPKKVPIWKTFRKKRHFDWKFFLPE